jgi:hypothetical protein
MGLKDFSVLFWEFFRTFNCYQIVQKNAVM